MKLFSSKGSDKKQEMPRLDEQVFGVFANLPKPYKEATKMELDKAGHTQTLANLRNSPVRLLQEAAQILTGLNRAKIKPPLRAELLTAILEQVYPVIAMLYGKYQGQENSLPETNERRNELSGSINVVEQLAIGYKQLFVADFSTKPAKFTKSKETLSLYAFRILEMLRLLQRLKALRYKKFTKTDWLDCNQVFFSMLLHNAVDDTYRLFGSTGLRDKLSEKNRSTTAPLSSIREIYISVQLFGLLDVSTWPTRFFHVPDALLDFLGTGLQITADNGMPLQPGWLLTYLKNDGPPVFERHETIPAPIIRIDYTVLFNALAADHEAIAKMKFISAFDPQKLSKSIRNLDDEDRVPLLEAILMTLKQRKRTQKRHPVFKDEALRVYFGKQQVMRLLHDISDPDFQRVLTERKFVDTLAMKSAMLAEDDIREVTTHWTIVNFSAGGLLISTEETSFSSPIKIGQLVAFSPANADIRKPTIGYVNRMNRREDKHVEVALVRLSNHAEPVVIQNEKDIATHAGHAAVLIQDLYSHWQLIVNLKQIVNPGDPMKLIRSNGEKLPVRLGDIWIAKSEFTIYELRSPGLKEE